MDGETSSTYILPTKVAAKLRCKRCNEYLSCGIIKTTCYGYICGRCSTTFGKTFPQACFEDVLSLFKFPCKFDKKGCLEKILFNQIIEHEDTCSYRIIQCPTLNCPNTITASELYNHIQTCHPSCVVTENQFKLDLSTDQIITLTMIENDCVVIVKYCFCSDSYRFQFSLFPMVEKKKRIREYKLQIIDGTVLERSVNTAPLPYHAIYKDYDMYGFTSIFNKPNFVFIKISLIFCDDALVDHKPKLNSNKNSIEKSNSDEEEMAEEKFAKYSCNCCRQPAIFCNCNNAFEYVSDIPCQWKGCNKDGDKRSMLEHNKECQFQLYVCPFLDECEKGLFKFDSAYISHLGTHALHCPDPNKIVIRLFNEKVGNAKEKVYNYFTLINKNVISITCKIVRDKWTLLCCSPTKIKVSTFFTHEHCRFRDKQLAKFGTSIQYFSEQIQFRDCFNKFPRLQAVLKIEI